MSGFLIKEIYRPYLVEDAEFDGKHEFPIVKNKGIVLPQDIVPFEKRHKIKNKKGVYLHFYMRDEKCEDVYNHPEKYIEEFKGYSGVIGLDMTIVIDAPFSQQLSVSYNNRAIAYFWQKNGVNVIPNVRWADKDSFEFCFLGLEPNGIYAISTHGCIKSNEEKKRFKKGLKEMLRQLTPKCVVVHGPMPKDIFNKYMNVCKFLHFDSWIKRMHDRNLFEYPLL